MDGANLEKIKQLEAAYQDAIRRIEQLEATYQDVTFGIEEIRTLSLSERLEELTAKYQGAINRIFTLEGKPKDNWDRAQAIGPIVGPLLAGAVIVFVGYLFIDKATLALKEREVVIQESETAEARYTKARALYLDLLGAEYTDESAESKALSFAALGKEAIRPLLNALNNDSPEVRKVAELGLREFATTNHRKDLCRTLANMLKNRLGVFLWQTHQSAIELLGHLKCKAEIDTLRNYKKLIEEAEYKKMIRGNPQVGDIRKVLNDTLNELQ